MILWRAINAIRRWWRTRAIRNAEARRVRLSPGWMREQERQTSRVEFHGPRIVWPIRKEE